MATPRPQSPSQSRRVVLVTGASGGIGRAICLEFARTRWSVGVHYHSRLAEAERTAAEVGASGGDALPLCADVRRADQVEKMVGAVIDHWGHLDVLVCAAGLASRQLLTRTGAEVWDAIVETNLTGAFLCMKAAAERMLPRRSGGIVVIGSYAGLQGRPGQAAYAASKAGLVGLVKTAAREWGPSNLRVNLVLPGWQHTAMTGFGAAVPEDLSDHALGRSPSIQEVARSVVHLAQLHDVSGQLWNLDSRIIE